LELEAGILERTQAAFIEADVFRLVVQELPVAHLLAGRGNVGELGNRRPPRLRGDRRTKVFLRSVAELDSPGDRALALVTVDANAMTERREVGIAAHVDRVL